VSEEIPGPRSRELHGRASRLMKGYSSQVQLFPVVFEKGRGVTLTDVDGNTYLDFSSGIYVTSLGHCHPKVSEAVAKHARTLMNCHDFTTPIKVALLEKLEAILPGDLSAMQLYDSGTAAVEAGLRLCRAASGNWEFLSCFRDFHGKTLGAASCSPFKQSDGPTRAPGFHMLPRPDPYRPHWRKADGSIDTDAYLAFYQQYLQEGTAGKAAAFVLEPVQGWAGSIFPPDDFFPKLRRLCDERGLLLMADEVLTCMGRTGKWLAMEHWNVLPDVVILGKGLGNGFPVTAMVVRAPLAEAVEKISASTSYGGNPMACAAALASIEVIEEEGLLAHAAQLGELMLGRMRQMKERHPIIGDVRGKGCLLGIELVRDRASKEPFEEAGRLVYQKAFRKGLAWIPAGHILRMSPPIIMEPELAQKGLEIVEEAIAETEKEFGYCQ
jgi:4-aminobutyrate aminotransferase/4-aminobutyrate aminotransferase/(S)-3-amino-2-methylpropionate transaminase